MDEKATLELIGDNNMDERLSPPLSQQPNLGLPEYSHTPAPSEVPLAPYTPPRSHPGQKYSYDDPERYEMSHSHRYYAQSPSYQNEGYRTPPLPITDSGMLTRSGRALGTPMTTTDSSPSSRMSSSPRPRRNRKGKNHITKFILNNPLSVETREYEEPVRDMMAWANRSHEERRQEVSKQHKGNVPRPLNSFMLYRQAYKDRIKRWGEQGNNNQLISRVAGESWNMEPAEVKEFYAKVAIVERDNHASAFPEYKFAPNKNTKKRGRNEDDEESDPDWECSSVYSSKRRRGRQDTEGMRSRSSTPARLDYPSPYYHPSSFQASNPHMVAPIHHFQRWGQPVQYDQYYDCASLTYHDVMQNMHYAPTSVPVQQEEYMHLVGMPAIGEARTENLSSESIEYAIDPGLTDFDGLTNYKYDSHPSIDHHVDYGEVPEPMHPGMQTLTPAEPLWSPAGPAGSAFDVELTQWHGES